MGADGGEDGARIKNPEVAEKVTELLQLESSEELCFALTTLRTTTRGTYIAWHLATFRRGTYIDEVSGHTQDHH